MISSSSSLSLTKSMISSCLAIACWGFLEIRYYSAIMLSLIKRPHWGLFESGGLFGGRGLFEDLRYSEFGSRLTHQVYIRRILHEACIVSIPCRTAVMMLIMVKPFRYLKKQQSRLLQKKRFEHRRHNRAKAVKSWQYCTMPHD